MDKKPLLYPAADPSIPAGETAESRRRMTSVTIKLPDALGQFVEEQAAAGGYGTADQYLLSLIDRERKRKAQEQLEALLIEGLDSGPGVEMTSKEWEEIRSEVRRRITAKGSKGS